MSLADCICFDVCAFLRSSRILRSAAVLFFSLALSRLAILFSQFFFLPPPTAKPFLPQSPKPTLEDFFLRRCNCNDFCEYSDSTSSVSGSFVGAVVARGADVFVGEVIDCAEVGRFIDVVEVEVSF